MVVPEYLQSGRPSAACALSDDNTVQGINYKRGEAML